MHVPFVVVVTGDFLVGSLDLEGFHFPSVCFQNILDDVILDVRRRVVPPMNPFSPRFVAWCCWFTVHTALCTLT